MAHQGFQASYDSCAEGNFRHSQIGASNFLHTQQTSNQHLNETYILILAIAISEGTMVSLQQIQTTTTMPPQQALPPTRRPAYRTLTDKEA